MVGKVVSNLEDCSIVAGGVTPAEANGATVCTDGVRRGFIAVVTTTPEAGTAVFG